MIPVSAGTGGGEDESAQPGENRYLFITTQFDPSRFKEPAKPENTDFLDKPDSLWTSKDHEMKSKQMAHDEWERKLETGRSLSEELNARFAKWYYVISADSFDKLRLPRSELVQDKPKRS